MNTLQHLQEEIVDPGDGLFFAGPIYVRLDPNTGNRINPHTGDEWTSAKAEASCSAVLGKDYVTVPRSGVEGEVVDDPDKNSSNSDGASKKGEK